MTSELPDYLEEVIEKAVEMYNESPDRSFAEVACEIAYENKHLAEPSWINDDKDNLDVLKDIRDYDSICADELDTYKDYISSSDKDESLVGAIVVRSLEELIHTELQERIEQETLNA